MTSSLMEKELYDAVKDGNVNTIEDALRDGANVDYRDADGWTPLLAAASEGQIRIVEILLTANATVNLTNDNGDTALHYAAYRGYHRIVRKLLAAGANVDAINHDGNTPLHDAASNNQSDVARYLYRAYPRIDIRNKDGYTAAEIFASEGDTITTKLLCDYAADVKRGDFTTIQRLAIVRGVNFRGEHEATPLHMAAQHGHRDLIQQLLQHDASLVAQDDHGCTPMHLVCAAGDVEAVTIMGKGPHLDVVDKQGRTPLDVAARFGWLEVVRVLVDVGASLLNVTTGGHTILHLAVLGQNVRLVEYVLANNCVDVNASNKRRSTALHYAVQGLVEDVKGADIEMYHQVPDAAPDAATAIKQQLAVVDLLLATDNININATNHKGETPLMVALSSTYHQDVILWKLITSGVDVNIPNKMGQTPLFVAIEQDNAALVRLLLNYGARTDVVDGTGRTPLSVAATGDVRLVDMYHYSEQYHERCFALLNTETSLPTITQVQELVSLITSVYDLRLILALERLCDDDIVTKRMVIKAAFHHVTENQLAFDEDAGMFFKLLLKHCEQEQLLSHVACEFFDRRFANITNHKSTQCAFELKMQVHTKSWQLDTHEQHLAALVVDANQVYAMVLDIRGALATSVERLETLQAQMSEARRRIDHYLIISSRRIYFDQCLVQNEQKIVSATTLLTDFRRFHTQTDVNHDKNKWLKHVSVVVASVTAFVLAPTLAAISNEIVDLMDPLEIVTTCGLLDVTTFLLKSDDTRVPMVIQRKLTKYGIPSDAFEELLREAIALMHPEIIDECSQRGLSIAMLGGTPALVRSIEPLLDAVTSDMSHLLQELQEAKEQFAMEKEDKPISSLVEFPLHYRYVDGIPEVQLVLTQEHERLLESQSSSLSTPDVAIPMAEPLNTKRDGEWMHLGYAQASSSTNSSLSTAISPLNVIFLSDPIAFPYHAAIAKCGGDVLLFQELTKAIEDPVDANASMEMCVIEIRSTIDMLCAAQYAYFRGYQKVGEMISARMTNPPDFDKEPATFVLLKGDITKFPYVLIVDECDGDPEVCADGMDTLTEPDYKIDDQIEAIVGHEFSYTVTWPAYEYAAYLGYVDVVKHLFKTVCNEVSLKARMQVIKRVRKQARALDPSALN